MMTNHQIQVGKSSKKKKRTPTNVAPFPLKEDKYVEEIHAVFMKLSNERLTFVNEHIIKEANRSNRFLLSNENKSPSNGHISNMKNLYRKVSALPMAVYFPTPFLLYKKELAETFSNGLVMKLVGTTVIGAALSLADIDFKSLLNGFLLLLIIAVIDAILGIIPNTVNGKKAQKDHTLQAKFWMFLTNVLGLAAMFAIHFFLESQIQDPNLAQKFVVNVHYISIACVAIIYFTRITKYIATVNKTRVPKFISTIFNGKK
jgi:hypothetical protein